MVVQWLIRMVLALVVGPMVCAAFPAHANGIAPIAEASDLVSSTAVASLLDSQRIGTRLPTPQSTDDRQLDSQLKDDWLIESSFSLVSDYRSGGISSTDGKPAVQSELSVQHSSGLFGRAWVSTIAPTDGGSVELNLTAGYSRSLGPVEPTVGVTAYFFPGVRDSSYVEGFAEISIPVSDATVTVGVAYTPTQSHVIEDNVYLGAVVDWPIANSRFSIDAAIGYEDGAFGDRKMDWQLGGRYRLSDNLEVGVAYADTRRAFAEHSGPALILSINASV